MRTMLQQLKAYVLIFLLILVLFSGSMGKATDHIDGAFTVENPRVDLTDLYAFVKNDSPKTLVVVLNVITAAQVWERPDENIAFEVLISPAKFDEVEKLINFSLDQQYKLSCVWQRSKFNCSSSTGTKVSGAINSENSQAGLRVFAGKRSDPFVLNGVWAAELAASNKIPEPFASNIIKNFNVYSIVAELDLVNELKTNELGTLAIGGQARNLATNLILDRIGRPEIANVVLQSNTGQDLRNLLNSEQALAVGSDLQSIIRQRIRENLDRYDQMDPAQFETDKDKLSDILSRDFLTIDLRLPCLDMTYFSLEAALLSGEKAQSCGGRSLEQDIIDSVYGLMVTGNPNNAISDGASTPTKPLKGEFPYLAEPNLGPKAILYSLAGRMISDLSVSGYKRTIMILVGLGCMPIVLALGFLGLRKFFRYLRY